MEHQGYGLEKAGHSGTNSEISIHKTQSLHISMHQLCKANHFDKKLHENLNTGITSCNITGAKTC
jgi:hypothetical protein